MPLVDPAGPITLEQAEQQRVEAAHRREDHRQSWGLRALTAGTALGALTVLGAVLWRGAITTDHGDGLVHFHLAWLVILTLLGTALTMVEYGLIEWLTRPARESAMNAETRGRQIELTLAGQATQLAALTTAVQELKPQIEREYARREWAGIKTAFADDLDIDLDLAETGTDAQVLRLPSTRQPS